MKKTISILFFGLFVILNASNLQAAKIDTDGDIEAFLAGLGDNTCGAKILQNQGVKAAIATGQSISSLEELESGTILVEFKMKSENFKSSNQMDVACPKGEIEKFLENYHKITEQNP